MCENSFIVALRISICRRRRRRSSFGSFFLNSCCWSVRMCEILLMCVQFHRVVGLEKCAFLLMCVHFFET